MNVEQFIKNLESKSIHELDFIITNAHNHSKEEAEAAKFLIEKKRAVWRENNRQVVNDIDKLIRSHTWFDFHVLKYDGYKLTVAGGMDLLLYHSLEIIFEDVFFVSGFFNMWASDTLNTVFYIPDNEIELNIQYEIEQNYQLFAFKTEDYKNDIIIAANSVTYNTNIDLKR